MRERGLKQLHTYQALWLEESLPMRERGLKHVDVVPYNPLQMVAPHAGAWIETLDTMA